MQSEDLNVAQVIKNQIGARALFMIGARKFLAGLKSLQFQVGRNPKGITTVVVKLAEDDTYTVEAWVIRAGNALRVRKVEEVTQVYNSEVAQAVSAVTGLAVSL